MEPSERAKIVTRRTYSRPLDDDETQFESWDQTIDRVIGHQKWLWERALTAKILPDMPLHDITEDMSEWVNLNREQEIELEQLRLIMLNREALPSGRTLWLGGTDIAKRREASQFNCLRDSTEFVTDKGVKSFKDFNSGDYINVLTKSGEYKAAKVKYYGKDKLNKLTFKRAAKGTEQVVYATSNHRWYLKDGSITENITNGQYLDYIKTSFWDWDYDIAEPDEQYWWCFGFVYGDGTLSKSENSITSRVRLCGNKTKYLDRFIENGFSYSTPPSFTGEPMVYTGQYKKTLPDESSELRLIKAFIRGYLDADGEKDKNFETRKNGNIYKSIQATGLDTINFIRKFFPAVGLFINTETEVSTKTNYSDNRDITIKFQINGHFDSAWNTQYKLISIEEGSIEEDVWCLEVEDEQNFLLPNGIVTGNCAHTEVQTVYDVVDIFWLLLQGAGVGFTPVVGTLTGFRKPIPNIKVIRSKRTRKGGKEENDETFIDGVWTIKLGDSAEAWAKSIGKLLAGKYKAHTLVFDFSEIRPEGLRLKGYGWISSGDGPISRAFPAIAEILNKRAGAILTKVDIVDICNWLGTVLSSRRSAEIALVEYGSDEWREFAKMKQLCYTEGYKHRQQSNNSLVFYHKPTREQLSEVFDMIIKHGGSEPGIINGETAKKRAPWFSGVNPCGEILLGNKSFCNLTEIAVCKFDNNMSRLFEIIPLIARANYRQTVVDFRDGILQEAWHLNNEFLRLCGVSTTGTAMRDDISEYDWKSMNRVATNAISAMAKELDTQRSKNITTGKPSGTLSKIMEDVDQPVWEGIHKPLGRYVFNWIVVGQKDPLVEKLKRANYKWILHPSQPESILFCIPIDNGDFFDKVEVIRNDGSSEVLEINLESAIDQLERYKKIQMYYCDQNVSNTISYDVSEKDDIIDWLLNNWDIYVGVSFLFRNDPTLSAKDLGYEYLPQEVVTKERYENYISNIEPVNFEDLENYDQLLDMEECVGGVCPVR